MSENQLSKNQQKKLRKQQEYLARKEEIKATKREAKKRKRVEKQEENKRRVEMGLEPISRPRKFKKEEIEPIDVNLVIDVDFEDQFVKLLEKDMRSLSSQLSRAYCINRSLRTPPRLFVCGQSEKFSESMNKFLPDYVRWKEPGIKFEEKSFVDLFDKDKIIYLTADSENVLESLDESMTYVIGGIVDHNQFKRLCLDKAQALGIKHAKLPIGDFIKMNSRRVLTVNQVVEILVNYIETKDWKESFLKTIPQRKGPELKETDGSQQSASSQVSNDTEKTSS